MRKSLLALTALAAAALLDSRPALAYPEGPWCAVSSFGRAGAIENCSFRNLESCRMEVIAGNRGFCRHNARWPGWSSTYGAEPRKARKKRARR
jgi:hypothetical protein